MSRNNKLTATLAGTLAALALGGSTAGAMPINSPQEYDAGHASIAQEQAQTQAAAQSKVAVQTPQLDLRSADAKAAGLPPRLHPIPVAGQPSWPANPVSLHSTQAPVNNDDGTPWLTIALAAFGAVLVGGGAAFAVAKTTRSRRARVAA